MQEIKFVEVNKDNYKKAIKIQQKLYPYENGDIDILESVGKRKKTYNFLKYYLVKCGGKYVGITGFYAYDIYPNDAWLTWAGFLPDYDTSEINILSLNFIKQLATEKGFKTLRVYTDEIADKEDITKIMNALEWIKRFIKMKKINFIQLEELLSIQLP